MCGRHAAGRKGKVLFAEYLVWDTPFRVGSHYYAGHFLNLGWEVGWLGGEFHPFNLLNNWPELARKFMEYAASDAGQRIFDKYGLYDVQ